MRRGAIPLFLLLSAVLIVVSVAATGAQAALPVRVVAAENFYGDVARQIGGEAVSVMSIMADPAIDPHEYESTVKDAMTVADADLVIENGGGYDAWMDKLLAASPRPSRIVVKGFDLAVTRLPDNEHVWYSVDDVGAIAAAVSRSLQELLPQSAGVFARNERAFQESLRPIRQVMARISARWAGTPVGVTEIIFLYQALFLRLTVLTPLEFQKAISEGNDPPADAVVEAENQIRQRRIRLLVVNVQTVSPIVARARDEAKAAGIPVVGVTETMPPGQSYQTWMLRQLGELAGALARSGS